MEFVRKFERQCSSQASVKRLRVHVSYTSFHNRWNLPVYFQLRCINFPVLCEISNDESDEADSTFSFYDLYIFYILS